MTKPRTDVLIVVTMRNAAGAQRVALHVARGLRRRGYGVRTCFLYHRALSAELEDDSVLLLDHPPQGLADYLRIMVRLWKLLVRARPRAIHTILPMANVITAPLAMLAGIRTRVSSLHYPAAVQKGALGLCDRLWGKLGVYTKIVAVSRFVADSVSDHSAAYRRRIIVILNGLPERRPRLSRSDARRRFGVAEDTFLLVSVARLEPQKNLDLLIEITRQLPAVHTVVAGDGPERNRLQESISKLGLGDRFRLLGIVPYDDVPDLLGCADLFALTSHYEGLPLVLIEAMHAGLPIIGSDIPSIRETVTPEGGEPAAILGPVDSAEPWVHAISAIQSGQIDRRDLVSRGVERSADFRLEAMVDAYEQILIPPRRRPAALTPRRAARERIRKI